MQISNHHPDAIAEARAMVNIGLKRCTSCGEVKLAEQFPYSKKGAGGYASLCKVCFSEYDKNLRAYKYATDIVFCVNKAILKRQQYGTHVCWLSDKSAYKAAAYLLDEYGLLTPEDGHLFCSVFKNNLPDRIKKLDEKAQAAALVKQAKESAKAERNAKRLFDIEAKRLAKIKLIDVTETLIHRTVFLRMQYHLKHKQRVRKVTNFSFTKLNFSNITGYTVKELCEHLTKQLPHGKTWADVINGFLAIDHIIPSAAFNLTTVDGIRRCYALSNLTFLTPFDNSSKGSAKDKSTIALFKSDPESARLFGVIE